MAELCDPKGDWGSTPPSSPFRPELTRSDRLAAMTWSIEERRGWLFPPVSGVVDEIDLAFLDPSDADDRGLLVAFEHPEHDRAREDEEVIAHGGTPSRRLHLTIHEVVANQIWDGNPEDTWRTAERLTGLGYDRHEVLHMLGSAVGAEIWRALSEESLHEPDLMAEQLAALPESWEAQRQSLAQQHDRQRRPRRGRH